MSAIVRTHDSIALKWTLGRIRRPWPPRARDWCSGDAGQRASPGAAGSLPDGLELDLDFGSIPHEETARLERHIPVQPKSLRLIFVTAVKPATVWPIGLVPV